MDRASGFGPEGWGFESLRVYKGQERHAPIAQLVEQLALNQTVGGSNPSGRTINWRTIKKIIKFLQPHIPILFFVLMWPGAADSTAVGDLPESSKPVQPIANPGRECNSRCTPAVFLFFKNFYKIVFIFLFIILSGAKNPLDKTGHVTKGILRLASLAQDDKKFFQKLFVSYPQ